jgi:hypothetical protein
MAGFLPASNLLFKLPAVHAWLRCAVRSFDWAGFTADWLNIALLFPAGALSIQRSFLFDGTTSYLVVVHCSLFVQLSFVAAVVVALTVRQLNHDSA